MMPQRCIPRYRGKGPEDDYGHPAAIYTEGPPQRCSIQTSKSMGYRHTETHNAYEAQPLVVYYNVYFENTSTLTERDQFKLDGRIYELDLIIPDASGRNNHQEGQCHLVREA
ncbi:MAG TPA: hypothetical protein VNN23_02075 [Ornithinibacter sp.]|nr:hypothetical protein [Ornithinibacter sp.]